jgi:MFS transporter, Spinster family, sphingosine-1-phosphate transporter
MQQTSYKRYLLALLTIILAFNYMDRVALGVVLENIKADLALSDTQLGVLSGIAFALFYSVMGIPIARWADRGNRLTIISLTAAVWSVAVSFCAMATSFVQLVLIRIGVGVGEAGCIPPAHSLIADYFTRAERPHAVALYSQGGSLAMVFGYFATGWLNELFGWRATFVMVGVPGIVLAALARSSLKEPRLMSASLGHPTSPAAARSGVAASEPNLKDVCVALWANIAFRHLLISFSLWYFFGYGILQWQPTFFIRSHGLTTGEVGTWFAVTYGLAGGLGTYLGGEWASRYAARNERLQLNVCALTSACCAVLTAASLLVPNHHLAFGLLGLANLSGYMSQGPVLATIQTLVAPRMRATSIALIYLFANLIGMGLGPLGAGVLSDALRPWLSEESLRYALVLLCPGYVWAAWHVSRAGRTVARDLMRAHVGDDSRAAGHNEIAVAE